MTNTVLVSNTVRVKYTVRVAGPDDPRERSWQAGPVRVRVTLPSRSDRAEPKERLTTERIVDTAMALMAEQGYEAVSMRSLARALDTGPASLYAHVANRDELDQLVIDRIARLLEIPEPDPDRWADQLKDVLRQMRDLYHDHPGSARAAMAQIPTMEGSMRAAEGIMAICVAGGISPQAAAWMCDLAALYVSAVGYEESLWVQRQNSTAPGEEPDHEAIDAEMVELWNQLPPELFPLLTKYSPEMTAGDGHDRFEFAIDVLVAGLTAVSEKYR
jgi:AcrR family transcriptional regulator